MIIIHKAYVVHDWSITISHTMSFEQAVGSNMKDNRSDTCKERKMGVDKNNFVYISRDDDFSLQIYVQLSFWHFMIIWKFLVWLLVRERVHKSIYGGILR